MSTVMTNAEADAVRIRVMRLRQPATDEVTPLDAMRLQGLAYTRALAAAGCPVADAQLGYLEVQNRLWRTHPELRSGS